MVNYIISSGEVSSGIILNRNDFMTVLDSGAANITTVNFWGSMNISSGGTANSTTVNDLGRLHVSSGGTANSTTVNAGGIICVFSGGIANDTTVNSSGHLYVPFGGTVTGIKENGGYVNFEDGANVTFMSNSFSGLELSSSSATIHSGTTAISTTVLSGGSLYVSSGGTGNSTMVNSGHMLIYSDGVANSTTVNSGGSLHVSSGGTANSTTVSSGGNMFIYSGGTATITFNPWKGSVVSSSGAVITYLEPDAGVYYGNWNLGIVSKVDVLDSMNIESGLSAIVYSGGTANNIIASSGACISFDVALNTYVKGTYDGSAFEMKDASISGYAIHYDCSLTISSGGVADGTVVSSGGSLDVSSGGTANSTALNYGGRLLASSGGTAIGTTVSSGGYLIAYSGGTLDSTTVNEGGLLRVNYRGTANSTTVNSGGNLDVSGGTASNTTINWGGKFYISSGGTADRTTLNSGWMEISSGGVVNITTVAGGNMDVSSGGVANSTTMSGGGVNVYSDGTTNKITISSEARGNVHSGGIVNTATVNAGGSLYVESGGTATEVSENGGYVEVQDGATVSFASITYSNLVLSWNMTVHSGTTAVSTTIDSRGGLYVFGGKVDDTTISNGGGIYVSSGGTANDTVVDSGGSMLVSSGGTVNNTTIKSGGNLHVSDSGVANLTTVESYGSIFVSSGGVASNTTINWGGKFYISSGGTAKQTTIESGWIAVLNGGYASNVVIRARNDRNEGDVYVSSGGIAEDVIVEQYGDFYVSSGGTANNTVINAGGYLRIDNGGTATMVKENGGYVDVQNGAEVTFAANMFSGMELVNASATVHSGTIANQTSVASNSYLRVYEAGTANETTVGSAGYFYVYDDGTANSTTINTGGYLWVSSGATASKTTVQSGGFIFVSSGATATEVTAETGAYLEFCVTSDTLITGTSGGTAFEIKNGAVTDDYVLGLGYLELGTGVKANGVAANSGGRLYVSSGATATGILEKGGYVGIEDGAEVSFVKNAFSDFTLSDTEATVHAGTTATNITASSGGRIRVYSDGIVDGVNVSGEGFLYVSSGGTATTIKENGGYVSAADGAVVAFESTSLKGLTLLNSASIHSNTRMTSTTVSRGGLYVSNGGIADTIIMLDGRSYIFSGGAINNTTIYSRASIEVSSGGTLNGVNIKSRGSAIVYDGGTLRDLNISSGGTVYLRGGKMSGKIAIENGAYVTMNDGATLDFDISEVTPDAEARVNDLSLIRNSNLYTLTVGTQKSGSYVLAEGALRFNSTITVFNTDGVQLGTLTAGNTLTTEKATYTLVSFGESLSVDVETFAPKAPTASADITSATEQEVTVTAVFSVDCTVKEYSFDNKNWLAYTAPIVFMENGTVYFRGTDGAGNLSEVTTFTVDNIISTSLKAPVVIADMTTPTNGTVTVSATFSESATTKQYSIDGQTWLDYMAPLTFKENGTVIFLCQDATGAFTCASYTVNNIDTIHPTSPAELQSVVSGQTVALVWNSSTDDGSGVKEYIVNYSLDDQLFTATTSGTSYVLNDAAYGTWNWNVQAVDFAGNKSTVTDGEAFTVSKSVTPGPQPVASTARNDINGNGISDVTFHWGGGDYQVGFWLDNTSQWQSQSQARSAEWNILGTYDVDANGKADLLMAGQATIVDMTGMYIGYYEDSIDTSDNWHTIGFLSSTNDWSNAVGNLTGETGRNSIVWYAPELYALGAWTDGTDSWTSISASFGGKEWTLIGCGDFDGIGKDAVLMSYNKGQFYYTVDIDQNEKSLGSSDWRGWDLHAIGDFAGDGKDDLVLFHEETGSMVLCADGNVDSYKSIGQLAAKDWFVVGAGDYNGDQKDDLLVRQYSTGMLGYYSSGDMAQWTELGRGVDMDWTVIA